MSGIEERIEQLPPLQRAVFALKETQAKLDQLESRRTEPIAIVGMACRFPGGVNNPEDFWTLLCNGTDAIGTVPKGRWDVDRYFDEDPATPGTMNSLHGGFVEGIDEFDNRFFGMTDREAEYADPQHRMLLELTWQALEDAGIRPSLLRGSKTGVFVGISISEYAAFVHQSVSGFGPLASTGTALGIAANRISHEFDFCGPSLSVDTACSSSLVAIHLACQAIRNGECTTAIVGGSNAIFSPLGSIHLTKSGMSSPDGKVKAFDADANGYVRGEGAAVIVLRPASVAKQQCDPIYATIRGSAVVQTGRSNGISAPSGSALEEAVKAACRLGNVDPRRMRYVEAQGTGTLVGDALEAKAMGSVLNAGTTEKSIPAKQPLGRRVDESCCIGSVKTNIGHLEAASGMASVIKVALSLKNREVPPSLHFNSPNPMVSLEQLKLTVPTAGESLRDIEESLVAGVNAFGFGGTTAHVVLEESSKLNANCTSECVEKSEDGQDVLMLSARTDAALRALAVDFRNFLQTTNASWKNICRTAAIRRDHHERRLAVVVNSAREAAEEIDCFLEGNSNPTNCMTGSRPANRNARVAFWFSGELLSVDDSRRVLCDWENGSLLQQPEISDFLRLFLRDLRPASADLGDPEAIRRVATLVSQFVDLGRCESFGVKPDFVIGAGIGELTAAHAAGCLTIEEAIRIAIRSSAGPSEILNDDRPRKSSSLRMLRIRGGHADVANEFQIKGWRTDESNGNDLTKVIQLLSDREPSLLLGFGSADHLTLMQSVVMNLPYEPIVSSISRKLATPRLLQRLYVAGANIEFQSCHDEQFNVVRLPTYAWQRKRHWVDGPNVWKHSDCPIESDTGASKSAFGQADAVTARPEMRTPFTAPETELQKLIATEWSRVLRVEPIGIHDNFFELGGHSLMAMQLLARATQVFGCEIPFSAVFESPTVATMAALIEKDASSGAGNGSAIAHDPDRTQDFPILPTQVRMWNGNISENLRSGMRMAFGIRLTGPLDIAALERSLNTIIDRHEMLRSIFPSVDGEPVQRVLPYTWQKLEMIDLSVGTVEEREDRLERHIDIEADRPIDLTVGPIFRFHLVRLADEHFALLMFLHHIIIDGGSANIIARDLGICYAAFSSGNEPILKELVVQPSDIAIWQQNRMTDEVIERQKEFWAKQLHGLPEPTIPTKQSGSYLVNWTRAPLKELGIVRSILSEEMKKTIDTICGRFNVTPFVFLHSVMQIAVGRHTGQDDFAVQSPYSGRIAPETESLVSCFINVVFLRCNLGGNPTFAEMLRRFRETLAGAIENQDLPREDKVAILNDPDKPEPWYPYRMCFQVVHQPESSTVTLNGVEFAEIPIDGHVLATPLYFLITERQGEYELKLEYSHEILESNLIQSIHDHMIKIIKAVGDNANQPIRELMKLVTPPYFGDHDLRHRQEELIDEATCDSSGAAQSKSLIKDRNAA